MKPTRTPRSLGGRTLRLGARGDRVRRLQLHLHKLGYDPGPADGLYGHLTFAAVRSLQRDFRLHADGTAGRRVLAALSDEQLTNVHRRIVIAEIHGGTSAGLAARVLQRNAASLSGMALPVRAVNDEEREQEERAEQPVQLSSSDPVATAQKHGLSVWHTIHTRVEQGGGHYEPGRLQHVLHNAAGRDKLEQQAARLLTSAVGGNLYLDLGQIAWGDGGRLLAVVRKLSRHAARHGRELIVSVPLPIGRRAWDGLFKHVDRSALAALVTRIVLVPPLSVPASRPGSVHRSLPAAAADARGEPSSAPADDRRLTTPQRPPSPQQLSAAIRTIVRDVPPWRCLLMVPVGAVALSADRAYSPEILTYQQALALAYNKRTRPRWDETIRRPVYDCIYEGRPVSVWLENRYSIVHKLDVVDRWRLAGVYLSAIGLEDARVWGMLRERWQVYKQPDA